MNPVADSTIAPGEGVLAEVLAVAWDAIAVYVPWLAVAVALAFVAIRYRVDERISLGWARLAKPWRAVLKVALLVFLVFLPYLTIPVLDTPKSDFASVLFWPVGMYVLMAIGLNVVVGKAGLLDLGYVAFFAIGAYTMAVLGTDFGWSWPAALPVGIGLAMLAGVLLGSPTLRLRGDYLAIVTLGFGEIIRITARNTEALGGPQGISGIPRPPDIGPLKFTVLDPKPYYWLLLALIVVAIFVVQRLEYSRVGRAWTAIREDEDAAELMGVPTFRFKIWAFAIGAGIGGMGGTLYASKFTSITPDTFSLILSILFLSAVVLGGAGNLVGVIIGAIVIAYLPERFREFTELRVLVFGAALVVMMIFRPQGLIPSRRRAAELLDPRAHPTLGAETGVEFMQAEDHVDATLATTPPEADTGGAPKGSATPGREEGTAGRD